MATSTASLHKNIKSTLARIKRFLAKDDHFSTNATNQIIMKCHNSLHSQIYSTLIPVECKVRSLKSTEKTYEIIRASTYADSEFATAKVGDVFGPTWSTHLFKLTVNIPEKWEGKHVDLRWNSSSEAMLIDVEGNVLQGFVPKHRESFTISKCWVPNYKPLEYYVEMSCNGLFGALGEGFSIDPPRPDLKYVLKLVDIAVFEPVLFKLHTDLEILLGFAEELPNDIRGFQALYTANEMINLIINKDHRKASDLASKFFAEGNGEKAHTLVAMGHCHIDTAWLWTYAETKRKCARSWISQIQLMKDYPNVIFTCSQMQQLDWMKRDYPGLFETIKEFVALKRFIPVGGTWIEMDGLLPDGESFIRQFFYGQKFLMKEFNMKAKEFWLPDTFGYSGQIPQLMKHMGVSRFLTQKLSWNRVNKFPHHNFWWEGIDGSKVLVHFPPGDSYEMNGWVQEILKSVNNSEDKGRTNIGAYLYGHGDGGGGPTSSMIERLNRVQNVDGLPKVIFDGPDHLFEQLEADSHKFCKWVGELYLEMHNGTYTSQANIKWFNRKLEMLLKAAELKIVLSKISGKLAPASEFENPRWIEECWKSLLLNQFHDVIPGSCIELVAKDAQQIYQQAFLRVNKFLQTDANNNGLKPIENQDLNSNLVAFNPLAWPVKSLFCIPVNNVSDVVPLKNFQHVKLDDFPDSNCNDSTANYPLWTFGNPKEYVACISEIQPSGYSNLIPSEVKFPVTFTQSSDGSIGTFNNGIIRLEVSLKGRPQEKLFFQQAKNDEEWEVFKDFKNTDTEAGLFYVYDDNPVCWDAWDCDDFHLETRKNIVSYNNDLGSIEMVASGPLVGIYKWKTKGKVGDSSTIDITRYTIMKAESPLLEYITIVNWAGQSHKFLRAEFPVDVHSREASFDIQYGHIKRPTHSNTSWDMAQIEVSAHKWVDLSQHDRGVSLINDSKYGFQIKENIVKLSLLRSPKAPDENCDMHEHVIRYAILPHMGSFQSASVIRSAYEFNTNFEFYSNANAATNIDKNNDQGNDKAGVLGCNVVTTSHQGIIAEVVKLGDECPESSICIRLHESFGGSATKVCIKTTFPAKEVIECNGLEEPIDFDIPYLVTVEERLDAYENPNYIYMFMADFSPFQIRSFLIK